MGEFPPPKVRHLFTNTSPQIPRPAACDPHSSLRHACMPCPSPPYRTNMASQPCAMYSAPASLAAGRATSQVFRLSGKRSPPVLNYNLFDREGLNCPVRYTSLHEPLSVYLGSWAYDPSFQWLQSAHFVWHLYLCV